MNKNTEELLRELSAKLGTTTEHIWEVLLKQAPINATLAVLTAAIMLVASYLSIKYMIKKVKIEKNRNRTRRLIIFYNMDGIHRL